MKLLHVDASILGEMSVSRRLTAEIAVRLIDSHPGAQVIHYDLAAEPLGDLSAPEFLAWQGVEPQGEEAQKNVARNAQYLDDFLDADVIIVGAPMYNFGLPSQLKAWLDRLAVGGKTFRYTETGPVGMTVGKRVIIASSRGGFYSEGNPAAALDHQETYLRGFFHFLGFTDITFVRAEGLAVSPDIRNAAVESALSEIRALAA